MTDDKIWGNYNKLKLTLSEDHKSRSIFLEKSDSLLQNLSLQNQATAIQHRDSLISLRLKSLCVSHVIDFGSDFGSLLNSLEESKIAGIGVEISPMAVGLAREAGFLCLEGSIQDFLTKKPIIHGPLRNFLGDGNISAVTCLNILHSNEADDLRLDFIRAGLNISEFMVVTLYRHQLKEVLEKLACEVHSFLGHVQKPIGRWKSNVLQYGRPHFSENKILDWLESQITSIVFRIRPLYAEKILNYTRLVVIIKRSDS